MWHVGNFGANRRGYVVSVPSPCLNICAAQSPGRRRPARGLSHFAADAESQRQGRLREPIPAAPTMFVTTANKPAALLVSAQMRPIVVPTTSTATIAASQ
jgi:hypothetical protein